MDREYYHKNMKNVASIDGRHCLATKEIGEYFSEYALHKYRVFAEIKYLLFLSKELNLGIDEGILKIFTDFSEDDAKAIADYDHFGRNGIGPLEHDVKAVEYFLRERIKEKEWIHFSLTSEDVNNIAYNCMILESIKLWTKKLISIMNKIEKLSAENKNTPMLSRTHGQPASPTTFGKEMSVFLKRLTNELIEIRKIKLNAKLNGAVGNYNAFVSAYPDKKWVDFSKRFVESLDFDFEPLTNQRGPKDKICKLFQNIIRINNILKDFDIDMWIYISKDLVLQKPKASEVGSSTMPHKINPWQLECSEGAIELSNALMEVIVREIDVSRLQRDLSDHEHERSYGTAIAYSFVSLDYLDKFLDKIVVDKNSMLSELNNNKQVLSEAFQTVLRKNNVANSYEIMKNIFRGNDIDIEKAIDLLDVDDKLKNELKSIKVENYIGLAPQLVDIAINEYRKIK